MKKYNPSFLTIVSLCVILSAGMSYARSGAEERGGRLRPDVSVSFEPYAGPGHESMPVQVVSTTGQLRDGARLIFTDNCLKNRSAKTVRKVVFSLFIFDEKKPEVILETARWAPVDFQAGSFVAGKDLCMGQMTGSLSSTELAAVRRSLEAQPEGTNYRIALGVTEVHFEDGDVWRFEPPAGASRAARK